MAKKRTNRLSFAPIPTMAFAEKPVFLKSIEDWNDHYAHMDAEDMTAIDIDGNAVGTDYRLSAPAFSDVCRMLGVPERFIVSLTHRNESLGLEVLRDAISAGLLRDALMIVDMQSNRIDGFVRPDRYNPPDVGALVKMATTFSRDTSFKGGWICGTRVRLTATVGQTIDVKKNRPSKVGDLVGVGFELVSDIGPVGTTAISDYVERLSCTNGMISRSSVSRITTPHEGFGIDDTVLRALVRAVSGSTSMVEMAHRASSMFLTGDDVRAVRSFIGTDSHPASSKELSEHATKQAQAEVTADKRKPGEVCLWDFVNGVTDAAKHTSSLHARQDMEDFGYVVMSSFLPT